MSVINGFNNRLDKLIYSKPNIIKSNKTTAQDQTEQTLFAQRFTTSNKKHAHDSFINSKEAIKVFESNLNNERNNTIYDQPDHKTSNAIAAYTELAHIDRRAEVQNLIGIDTFA